MKILNKMMRFIALLIFIPLVTFVSFVVLTSTFSTTPPKVFAVTPPDRGLGAADPYGVFGALGVTNTGVSTHIWGDVGANSSVTGLDDATQVDGTIKIAPATNGVATDASSTYDSLMSSLQGTSSGLDLAGTNTIVPGVYDVAASTLNGALTLDGAGVYIFRSSSSNTTEHSGTMNLINGACASNVFWAVSTSMTIGTGAHVEGTIIASTGSITLATGATLVGRAISLTQQVTLLSNQITQPICAAPTATPTPSPTATPTPSPTATPTPSPTATPTVAPTATSSSDELSSTSTTVCSPLNYIAPIIIESKRIDTDSISFSWGPYSGTDKFIVQYGVENGKWIYSTNVTGFSTTLNALPSNQPIWIRIGVSDNCSLGNYGESKLVGRSSLPSTGFAPHENNILWNIVIPAGVVMLVSASIIMVLRKHTI